MRAFRKRLRGAVLAALAASACAEAPRPGASSSGGSAGQTGGAVASGASSGGAGLASSTGASGGSSGASGDTNICAQCLAQGLECNAYATGCKPPCSECGCNQIFEPVAALDGGYPDGGLPLPLCQATCASSPTGPQGWVVWSCGVADGGCPDFDPGMTCVECEVEACASGRAPEGLQPPAPSPGAGAPLGRLLARMAHLERASIPAFARMAEELRRFGAPLSLVRGAERALRDERRHARVMAGLARRFGAAVPPVVCAPARPRSLAAFAEENCREGCARETWGAALALWQSRRAQDPTLRRAMRAIAADEAAHAALAWRVHRWVMARLPEEEVRRLDLGRRRHFDDLRRTRFPRAIAREAGLPAAEEVERLWRQLAVAMDAS